jgi:hypothetical protein
MTMINIYNRRRMAQMSSTLKKDLIAIIEPEGKYALDWQFTKKNL